jgi:predicted alpha/beta-hydrolase family hydrolase
MKRLLLNILTGMSLILAPSVFAAEPGGSVYLDGGDSREVLILAHGRGKSPTWKVVDPLRKGVHDRLGYHTLSLQMPNEDKDWELYAEDFPAAYETIKEGIRFLREEKEVTRIFLMGHSMGARMMSAFVAEHPGQPIGGLIVAGCRNNGSPPLSCDDNLRNVEIPVLDIWGGDNTKDSDAADDRRRLTSVTYAQAAISGANHRFDGHEGELVSVVVDWLKGQK